MPPPPTGPFGNTGSAGHTQPPPPDLDSFLAAPAYGATELHVTTAIWRKPWSAGRIVGGVLDEVAEQIIDGGDPGSTPTDFCLRFAWVGPMGVAGTFETGRKDVSSDRYRTAMQAARRLRVGVRFFTEDNELVGSRVRPTGELYVPRTLPPPGKLAGDALVVDTPERFEASISRIEHPGLMGRKIKRQKPVQRYFQLVMDQHWVQINDQTRKGLTTINLSTADLLGIANVTRTPVAYTSTDEHPLPTLSEWSGVDYRGRELASWIYSRVLQRLGM